MEITIPGRYVVLSRLIALLIFADAIFSISLIDGKNILLVVVFLKILIGYGIFVFHPLGYTGGIILGALSAFFSLNRLSELGAWFLVYFSLAILVAWASTYLKNKIYSNGDTELDTPDGV